MVLALLTAKAQTANTSQSPTNRLNIPMMFAPDGKPTTEAFSFTTDAYKREALRLVIKEANKVAAELQLPEKLPITETNLTGTFIVPYGVSLLQPGIIGNVHTRDYGYYVSVGHKFSFVEGAHQEKDCLNWREDYQWPLNRIDTNQAYQLATQWMAAASMDVDGLNQDCQVRVRPDPYWNKPLLKKGRFVPIYDVSWLSPQDRAADFNEEGSVCLFAPSNTLISLRVLNSEYILRKPLQFTNLDFLLSQGSASGKYNAIHDQTRRAELASSQQTPSPASLNSAPPASLPEAMNNAKPLEITENTSAAPFSADRQSLQAGPLFHSADSQSGWGDDSQQHHGFGFAGSSTYRLEASRLLLKEANQAAAELNLPENLPISARNISRLTIVPPRLAKNMQNLGSVATSNYIYSASCGYKFSGVTRAHLQQEDNQLKAKYVLPMDQMDTNAAFQLAKHFLSLASMDVTALDRDCKVHISALIFPGDEHFVPIYNVQWVKRRERFGSAASVEVFLPDKSLRQLHVTRSEYILSQPAQITNPEFVNMPASAPPGRHNFGLPSPN